MKIVSIFIQTTIRTEAVSRKATSAPRRLPFSTSLPPKLPSAQPLIRTSVKDQVSTDRKIERKKNGKDVVIRFVSTAPPRPFKTKVNIYNKSHNVGIYLASCISSITYFIHFNYNIEGISRFDRLHEDCEEKGGKGSRPKTGAFYDKNSCTTSCDFHIVPIIDQTAH